MVWRTLIGGILGGIVVFFWGFVAHMVLPLQEMTVRNLPDEAAVVGPIKSTIKEAGYYLFPGMDHTHKPTQSDMNAWSEKAKLGPVGVVIVRPEGSEGFTPKLLLTELGTNIVSALLAAFLLAQVRIGTSYWTRTGLVTLMGVFAFVTILVPYWNWYYYPTDFMATEAIEHVVGWFLAGLVLAAIVRARGIGKPAAGENS